MKPYLFCPYDASQLGITVVEGLPYPYCELCKFTHWDNPIPTVATLVPMVHKFLSRAGMVTDNIPDGGVVLVRRKLTPFAGKWCLPCGFHKRHSHPKEQAASEVREETGLEVRLEQLVCLCAPMPGEVNQIVAHYVGRPVGGALRAGSDAADVGVFTRNNLPEMCFRSHIKLVNHWFAGELGTLTGQDLVL